MIKGLGNRLRNKRISRNLSQKDVANALGISPSIVSNYESGERTPSVENLILLARLFKCSTDYLLGLEKPTAQKLDISNLSEKEILLLQAFLDEIRP